METCPHCGAPFKGRTGTALKVGDHVFDEDGFDRGEIIEIGLIDSGIMSPGVARSIFKTMPDGKPITYEYNLDRLFTSQPKES